MWKKGTISIPDKRDKDHCILCHYWVKVYPRRSKMYGINGGRISKLMIKRGGEIVCNYDRGWDIKPSDPDAQLAMEIILHGENW